MTISVFYRGARRRWCVDVRQPGRRPVRHHFKTKAKAEQVKRELEAALVPERADSLLTVGDAAEEWLGLRNKDAAVVDTRHPRSHLRNHILPRFGSSSVDEVSRGDVLRFVRELREKPLKNKTVQNIHGTMHALFSWLVVEREVLVTNPCTLGRGRIPRQTPAEKLRHRANHTFTREEVETLISSPRIPVDRRTLYALQFFMGARRSEALELRWSDYDEGVKPLGRITVERSLGRDTTKTDTPRPIPVHPTLAAILTDWKAVGFETLVKRPPRSDDPIVPGARGVARTVSWTSELLIRDLDAVELRRRGTHSFRRAFQSIAIGDGAPRECIRALLHTGDRDSTDIYLAIPWESLCDAVKRLNVRRHSMAAASGGLRIGASGGDPGCVGRGAGCPAC